MGCRRWTLRILEPRGWWPHVNTRYIVTPSTLRLYMPVRALGDAELYRLLAEDVLHPALPILSTSAFRQHSASIQSFISPYQLRRRYCMLLS